MDSQLKATVRQAAEKLGVEITLRRAVGADKALADGLKIVSDPVQNKTYFRFNYSGEEYLASVAGADKVCANYAYLLQGMLENASGSDENLTLEQCLARIVRGEYTRQQVRRFHLRFNVPETPCYALVIDYPQGYADDIVNILAGYSANAADTPLLLDNGQLVFVKFTEDAADSEYRSAGEFAEYVRESIFEELGIEVVIGVGTPSGHLYGISASYRQAADAIKMSEMFNSKGGVRNYRDFVLVKMLEELPRQKLQEYLSVLIGEEGKALFGDEEMVGTAEEFLANSLNVSETSRELFMHRNTLMYRLDKIEKITGLNIKNFSDAVTFRLITVLNKLMS